MLSRCSGSIFQWTRRSCWKCSLHLARTFSLSVNVSWPSVDFSLTVPLSGVSKLLSVHFWIPSCYLRRPFAFLSYQSNIRERVCYCSCLQASLYDATFDLVFLVCSTFWLVLSLLSSRRRSSLTPGQVVSTTNSQMSSNNRSQHKNMKNQVTHVLGLFLPQSDSYNKLGRGFLGDAIRRISWL